MLMNFKPIDSREQATRERAVDVSSLDGDLRPKQLEFVNVEREILDPRQIVDLTCIIPTVLSMVFRGRGSQM